MNEEASGVAIGSTLIKILRNG